MAIRNTVAVERARAPIVAARARWRGHAMVWSRPSTPPGLLQSSADITRTAMCAEPRNGTLYIFMPPTKELEEYLELVAAIEATAEDLDTPVVLEGYEPPKDPRLNSFRVTPDPGVIEVNIHPSGSWDELVDRTTHLYDAARQSRLTTEKFMLDGRHTGTGGGNHFVLGGATPADSPFLRRPDLLRSLLAYWHNHPSLSYLFSGLFVGPTSQAPRIDEARNDSLYELELAFKQLPPRGQTAAALGGRSPVPQPADRFHRQHASRRVLHRQDVLARRQHRPARPARDARLRNAAARAHEPHAAAHAALADRALLARALRARAAGALGHRAARPLHAAVLHRAGSRRRGGRAEPGGISAQAAVVRIRISNSAFPSTATSTRSEREVELRQALEPWHVMGEEGAAGGAVRYVDSSVERLQVKVSGLAPDRYTLTCNGRQIPLRPTGTVGEFVAGVRYKAWRRRRRCIR